jgi:hypothetical protein
MIESCGENRVVCHAMNQAEALDGFEAFHPDSAFVDMNLEDGPTGPAIGARLTSIGVGVVYATANPEQVPANAGGLALAVKPLTEGCVAAALKVLHDHHEAALP